MNSRSKGYSFPSLRSSNWLMPLRLYRLAPAKLRHVFTAGEQLRITEAVSTFFQKLADCTLHNHYGPTESHVATAFTLTGPPNTWPTLPPIGRPIANMQIHIMDRHLQLVPIGVPGELHIGGIGLARGYHNRPELTAEKFIPNPFRSEPWAQLYKTGDLARYLTNGTIEYLGRMDFQVKIRGFRIELGEIESVLAGLPGVSEAVVIAREDVPGDKQLVAYLMVKQGEPPKHPELYGLLREKLPEYMVPSAFVTLDRFPLTPNGKVDRKALPAPQQRKIDIEKYVAPTTHTEQVLCQIWCKRLNLERVGTQDNFFEVGGYSLMAVQVVGEINAAFKVHFTILTFFQNPTVKQLARLVEEKGHDQPKSAVVPLQSGNVGLPLYIIGNSLPEHRIAQLIGEDRAVFWVYAPLPAEWSDAIATGDRAAMPTVEQLGALYGNVLHEHIGSSPCVVVGCHGRGKIAFEAAHTLQRAGGNVALVLLVDAFVGFGGMRGMMWQSLEFIWRTATEPTKGATYLSRLGALLGNLWHLLRWLLPQMLGWVKRRVTSNPFPVALPSPLSDKNAVPFRQPVLIRFSRNAVRSFHPRPLDAPGVLIRAEYPGEESLPGWDITNGWGDLFPRGLEIVQAKGDHVSIEHDENADTFRRQVNEVLDRYPEKSQFLPISGASAATVKMKSRSARCVS